MTSGVELKESEAGIVMSFPATDSSMDTPLSSSPNKIPRRIRRRLSEFKGSPPTTAEDIEAKLKEAEFRRQQFYELLSSKARPKPRSPPRAPSQEMEHAQRLEAKLNAAEQKRLSILAKAQMRLARLDELRQAAKSGVESRFVKERDELGLKVESRVQQAEANRMLILKIRQQKAAKKERTAQSLMRRRIQESKYKECVRAAIHQKRAAAERKRLGLLEAERSRARARLLRVQRAANSVYTQRETERMRMKDELEDRLLRAKRQRAEYLKQRKRSHCSPCANSKATMEEGFLTTKLASCWKQFVKTKGTTYSLAEAFAMLNLNERSVKSMPFEQLALLIESEATLQIVESLLKRLETRLRVQQEITLGCFSSLENIDHLLMRVSSPRRRRSANTRSTGARRRGSNSEGTQNQRKPPRYPVRVVLCAYMILGHPDAVLSGKGEHDSALAETATKFIQELETLIKIILGNGKQKSTLSQSPVTFRSQLEIFDKAWCSYLYSFVVWKVKDARLLEEDLVRAACQLELSMMQTCKVTSEGDQGGLTHDMKAVQKQVMEDQKLLKAKVLNLSGGAGIGRMETALSNMRSKYFKSQERGSPMTPPVAHIASPSYSGSEDGSPVSFSADTSKLIGGSKRSSGVARALFKEHVPSANKEVDSSLSPVNNEDGQLGLSTILPTDNELLVNEIVHDHGHGVADNLDLGDEDKNSLKVKVKETMEKAFWDGVMESVNQEQPDFSWVLKLVTEVQNELCEMSPSSWKQEINDAIDMEILSQVLQSGDLDMNYLGKILEFALVTLRKLAAPANDEDLKLTHQSLMENLAEISQSGNKASFVMALIRGLRFVLQQIQSLKKEISRARIKMIEPLIKGPAGLNYLQNAFSNRYGPASDAFTSLPLTREWLAILKPNVEQEWTNYVDSLLSLVTNPTTPSQGLPSVTLRTGGSVSMASNSRVHLEAPTVTVNEQPECKGERIDMLVRLSLLELVCKIEGLRPESLPETLKLNFARLRAVQSEVQKIITIATSMLVLRQTLLARNMVTNSLDMENIISQLAKRLSELLETSEEVEISEIVETIVDGKDCPAGLEKLQADKDVVANMLTKSLRPGDAIFTRVSRAIYMALRGVVLGGSGNKGKQLAEGALRRIGAAFLTDRVVKTAEVLIVVATVSGHVHGAWYDQLLKNM